MVGYGREVYNFRSYVVFVKTEHAYRAADNDFH